MASQMNRSVAFSSVMDNRPLMNICNEGFRNDISQGILMNICYLLFRKQMNK